MTERKAPFATVEEAVEEIRQGRMIVLVDDEDRENEGDLTMAADSITPEAINFMTKFGRGLICLSLTEQRCDALDLRQISPRNTSAFGTPFCEPIDAKRGTTTGISAADRATTILATTDPNTRPEDLARPGHVHTLRARNGGVLVRAGQTEACVDLARLAGRDHSGVICEIMNEDGTMARVPQLIEFCRAHNLKLATVADLIRYRMQHERYVRRIAESVLPTKHGNFRMIAYSSDIDHEVHVALVRGDLGGDASIAATGSRADLESAHRVPEYSSRHILTRRLCAFIRTASLAMCSAQLRAIATRLSNGRWRRLPRPIAACSFTCITRGADLELIRVRPKKRHCLRFVITGAKVVNTTQDGSGSCSMKVELARRF